MYAGRLHFGMANVVAMPLVDAAAPVPGARLRTRLAVWSVPAVMGVLYVQRLGAAREPGVSTWKLMLIGLSIWYAWVLFTPIVERLADRWPLRGRRLAWHVALHLSGSVVFTALQAFTAFLSSALLGTAPWSLVGFVVVEWFLVLLPAGVVVYGAVVAFRQATVTRVRLEQRERHAEQLMLALRDAQLTALRAQLQPHFLFNTLTAITALVRDGDSVCAASALEQLSVLLRSALRASDHHEVPLHEEVARLGPYLRIEEMRLGREVLFTADVPADAADALVPAWILQPLVENSVRHGLRTSTKGGVLQLTARVAADALHITLRDNGTGLAPNWEQRATLGYGLSNSRARLAALHGERAVLEVRHAAPHGVEVTLVLPYRREAT